MVRSVLAVLLSLVALNAIGGGLYGVLGAKGLPREWLAGGPFRDYSIPSAFLLLGVGGTFGAAAIAVFRGARHARALSVTAGLLALGWIAIQVALMGLRSFLQPVIFVAGVAVLGLAAALPGAPVRDYLGLYIGTALRPRRTFESLLRHPASLSFGLLALAGNALLYTVVYAFLVFGGGRPTVFAPWLAIDPEEYYRWNVVFVAPSMGLSFVAAAAVGQLVARALGGTGSFENTVAVLGFGTAIASWTTLLHDLVTSCLGAVHVLDQRAYEDALSSTGPLGRAFTGVMVAYLVAFVALFTKGLAVAHALPRPRATASGVVAFVVYQAVFVVFNR
ncbi:MAG TPA: YIP1 family protein [Polyangiaceae bacterium]|nr:YIP1 family protein [Polyangiaceae bacterium]